MYNPFDNKEALEKFIETATNSEERNLKIDAGNLNFPTITINTGNKRHESLSSLIPFVSHAWVFATDLDHPV